MPDTSIIRPMINVVSPENSVSMVISPIGDHIC